MVIFFLNSLKRSTEATFSLPPDLRPLLVYSAPRLHARRTGHRRCTGRRRQTGHHRCTLDLSPLLVCLAPRLHARRTGHRCRTPDL
nr:hypothetical protein Iba_chr11aCG9090 [Ipomoea batatas]GMD52075.1 hypothetical protein Iba_chr11bCG8410 [Ipomoea batatas]